MTPDDHHRGSRPSAYAIPTDQPEADGTLTWDADHHGRGRGQRRRPRRASAGPTPGPAPSRVIDDQLASVVVGGDEPDRARARHEAMARACRNLGRPGLVACAISAVDIALWDLKARTLDVALTDLFGRARSRRADLRQRRIHHLRRRHHRRPAARAGSTSGHPPGQDQDRRVLGRQPRAGPAPGGPGPAGDRRRSSSTSTPTAATRRKQAIRLGPHHGRATTA